MFKKSLLFMLLLALFMPWAANAQETVVIGEGTAGSNRVPIDTYYNYSISEQLYTADEIGMAGTITSISFNYINTVAKDFPIEVYMENVDAADLSTAGISLADADLVFAGTLSVTGAGWYTIDLDTPFAYDGTSNLLIGVNKGYVYWFSNNSWQCTATSVTMARYSENDNNAYDTSTTPSTASASRPNIQMEITPSSGPTCVKPTNLVVDFQGGGTATVTWEGEANSYNINVNGTITEGVTSPYTLSVEPNTTYNVKVQSVCGNDLTSGWTSAPSFTTPCEAFSLPYSYGFEDPNDLSCWSVYGSTSSSTGIMTNVTDAPEGTSIFAFYYSEQNAYLISPEFSGTEPGLSVSFQYMNSNATTSYMEQFQVGYTTNAGATDPTTFTYGDIIESENSWNTFAQDFPANTKRIAIKYIYTDGMRLRLDDFSFEASNPCSKPGNFVVGTPGPHSVELSWTETGSATEWVLYVNEKEEEIDQNPYVLDELDPETEYTVKVRAKCSDDSYSNWTQEITFTTDVACPAPTNVAVSNIAATSATVSWTGVGESYNLRYRAKTTDEYATITFAPNDVWQDGTGYQLLLDADATAYGTIIPETGGLTSGGNATAATYAAFEYKIPENADGAMNTNNVLIGESATIQVPAGTYDWCVTNPTPGDRIWIAGEGRGDDLVIEAGKTYEFVVQSNGEGGDEVVITDSGTATTVTANWTEINGVTSPYTISVEAEKDYIVEVLADCDADGTSAWASANFTTPSNCQVPTPLDVTDITAYTATLNWTGVQDNYQVQYRTKGSRELLFFEDFDNQPSTWTLTNAAYDRTSSQTSDYFVYLGYNTTETAYLITPELTINGAGTVEFKHRSYNGDATFQVGFSSTTNEVDAFTWGQEVSAAGVFFEAYSVAMPSGTKYVAIQSTTSATDNYVLINEFGIYGNEIPAGDWTTSTVNNATSCAISGLSGNKEYEWHVRGVNSSCDGGYTEWSTMATFTTEPSCQVPTDLDYQLEDDEAVLSWNSNANLFDIKVNETVIEGVTNPYTLALDPETIYYVSVRANCGDGDLSDWTDEIAFVSNCSGVKALPYTYGFENNAEYYACWYGNSSNTENSCGITSYASSYEGSNVFLFSSYNSSSTNTYDQYLLSPELNAENEMTVEFYYRTPSGYGSETFKVGYSTDGSEFTWGEEISTNTTEWTQYLDTVPAGTKYVAIHYYSNYQYYLLIDSFSFQEVASATVTQTIQLANGWNWISTYIEMEGIDGLTMLQESLSGNAELIKQGVNYTEYDAEWDEWFDSGLTEMSNEYMYLVKTTAACEVALVGAKANPADHPITINPGWNWIGFPSDQSMIVEDAFANFTPESSDKIQYGVTFNEYDAEWDMWLDSGLTELVPGRGYLYFYNGTTPQTLNFGLAKNGRGMGMKGIDSNKLVKYSKHFVTPIQKMNLKDKKVSTTKLTNPNNKHK